MSRRHRIITPHLVKRTALNELGRLFKVQSNAALGDPEAAAELERLGIDSATRLMIHQEENRRFHWAVVEPV
jgi:hypothetical protein